MPEANALFIATAVVVVGLVAWVAAALAMAKEPWARPLATDSGPPAEAPKEEAREEPKGPAEPAEPPKASGDA